MKTAISIPDDLAREIERFSRKHGWSRSEFFARAAEALLKPRRDEAVIESYNEAYADDGGRLPDEVQRRVSRDLLAVEWDDS
ncbi:MAG: hypothetical protein MUC96_25360 [Myxococcaceae bacterium]|jgi:hypothetical protein|nr:hypothetical protein [Myxococcaceae bacterium]